MTCFVLSGKSLSTPGNFTNYVHEVFLARYRSDLPLPSAGHLRLGPPVFHIKAGVSC